MVLFATNGEDGVMVPVALVGSDGIFENLSLGFSVAGDWGRPKKRRNLMTSRYFS
jgi:hypothetical protein